MIISDLSEPKIRFSPVLIFTHESSSPFQGRNSRASIKCWGVNPLPSPELRPGGVWCHPYSHQQALSIWCIPRIRFPHSGCLRDRTFATPLSIRPIMQSVHPLENKALFKSYTQIMRNSIPICAASPPVLAELYCWICPVDNPTCGFAKEKSVILPLERFSLTCFLAITNSKRFYSPFLSAH